VKIKIIDSVKSGEKRKKDLAEEYGIPASTLSTILKQEDLVGQQIETGNLDHKRVRKSEFPELEEC
jgi:transposase-like protein